MTASISLDEPQPLRFTFGMVDSSQTCCGEHRHKMNFGLLLPRARPVLFRISAAVVFWPRWRPGWASSWLGIAGVSLRSLAPSEGPGRPDEDEAPPLTTYSPAHRHKLYFYLPHNSLNPPTRPDYGLVAKNDTM